MTERTLVVGASGALGHYCLRSLEAEAEPSEIATFGRTQVPGFRHFSGSIFNASEVDKVLLEFRPTRLFLLAWETTHGSYWEDPVNKDWADATLNMANRSAELGAETVSFAGTCAEYVWGPEWLDDTVDPTEGDPQPTTLYGREKLRATLGILELAKRSSVTCQSCRIFSPFCEIETANRITSVVVRKALKGEKLHLTSGDVYRDIAHTKRIADAIVRLSTQERSGVFNISTGRRQHMGAFLQEIASNVCQDDLVSWNEWNETGAQTTQPRHLVGHSGRLGFELVSKEQMEADIKEFTEASMERFSMG